MSCNPELVSAFLDGELDWVILGTVTDHLLKCDECCQTMGWLAQVRDGVSDQFVLCDAEEMTRSVMAAIKNETISPVYGTLRKRLKRFGIPVAVITAALAAMDAPFETTDSLFVTDTLLDSNHAA